MSHSKVIDEIIDELFEEIFGTEVNSYYGKFVDENGVYELENGNLIKVIDSSESNFRSKRAEFFYE